MFEPLRIVTLCAFVLAAVVPAVRADEAPPPRTIHASGEAAARAVPDRARIAVSVISRGASASEAGQSNAATSKVVLEKLRAAVKPPGEVATAGYDLSPEYDYNQNPDRPGPHVPVLVGYVATNRLSITTGDLAGVGALIDSAVAAGAKQIDSISFFLDDDAAARREALLEAGRKARAEGEAIAQSLGVSLGEVLDASSTSGPAPVPMMGRERAMAAMDVAAPQTEVTPGSLEIRAGVAVTFAIH